ncbi:MAG TPA: AMP-binding protein, partial [Reyranella sp.]|nr:AMP-binding protein [Reyranella sp.]
AWTFPTFVERAAAAGRQPSDPFDAADLSEAEMSALLDHAFDRYFESSGLFGSVDRCCEMVGRLSDLGVDEIACLIDFGVPVDLVLESLPRLKQVMAESATERRPVERASVAEDIAAHRITHLQCTPSMASLLVADAAGRSAVASLETLVLGGEAMPMPLAREIRGLMRGSFLNAYGPTETTVWSSLCDIAEVGDFVPLGAPIANTSLHVLDPAGREVPALVPGELHIGGAGVARGYLGQPELTQQRFLPDPFAGDPSARLYRTGDIVRRHPDGALEFIGRADNQVKVRGHRVELGEIEVVLADQPGVKEAVADFREDPSGERRLLVWVTARAGATLDADALRQKLAVTLPDFMVPSRIIVLRALPLTPNGKIDRLALPTDDTAEPMAPPEGDTESLIAAVWCELLGVARVSRTANFFDLGGHSLMVLQVQRRLKAAIGQEIPIVDMFRCSTVRMLADLIDGRGRQETARSAIDSGISRARARRALLERRAS